jgi:hypothetical protein
VGSVSREDQVERVLAATVTIRYVRGEEEEHFTGPLLDLQISDERKRKLIRRILAAAEGTADNFTDVVDLNQPSPYARPSRNKRNPAGAAAYAEQKKRRKNS